MLFELQNKTKKKADIIAQAGSLYSVTISTNMAGRDDIVLGGNSHSIFASDVPLSELEKTSELQKRAEEKEAVIKSGGLFVLGVGRNESKRIDDQLVGRAGRQGDVGESLFVISLEDKLMITWLLLLKIILLSC